MKLNLNSRISALITLAFFLAISFSAFGQKSVPLATTRFSQLLTTGEAGTLRTQLLKLPGATVSRKGVAETHSGTFNRKAVTVEIASQFFNTSEGEVEQVTILVNEGGQATTIVLAQYGNGSIRSLVGDILQIRDQAIVNYEECLLAPENAPAACGKCEDQIMECDNSNTAIASACIVARILNPFGACVRCGVFSVTEVITCMFGF